MIVELKGQNIVWSLKLALLRLQGEASVKVSRADLADIYRKFLCQLKRWLPFFEVMDFKKDLVIYGRNSENCNTSGKQRIFFPGEKIRVPEMFKNLKFYWDWNSLYKATLVPAFIKGDSRSRLILSTKLDSISLFTSYSFFLKKK